MEHGIILFPDILGHLGSLPITNSLISSWIVTLILTTAALLIKFNVRIVPGGFQNLMEIVVETMYTTTEDLAGAKTKVIFPICATFFLYIFVGNYLGLFPGFGTITFRGLPLLRSMSSDLNTTLALALVSVIATHALSIKYLGIKNYLLRWVSLNPIFLFVGILEVVGEFTKIISLSFRLFGNIFAGETVLATISSIFAFVLPLPFYFLELVVGFVQAAVFMMLTLVFMVLLTEKHETH